MTPDRIDDQMVDPSPTPDADLAHHVPRLHIRPPRGYLNDPNGPVVIDGRQHLYFQYRHTTDLDAPVVWGHASSDDLVRWRLHRPAMAPQPTGLDRDGCWSGNTVLGDDGVLRAYYSGLRADRALQSTLLAESTDRGMSFGPSRRLVDDPDEGVVTFRDPFVWQEADGTWRMAVGAGDAAGTASVRSYTSPDGLEWSFTGLLAALPRTVVDGHDTGAMWECPQVLTLDGVRILLVGAWSEETGTTRVHAMLPDQAGGRAYGSHLLDQGPDFYAASAQRESPAGPIAWGWVREARSPSWWHEAGWAGTISLPRILTLGDDRRVLSRPHPAVALLRSASVPSGPAGVSIGAQTELELRAPQRNAELTVRFGEDEELRIGLKHDGTLVVDRTRASRDPRADADPFDVTEAAGPDGFDLRLFIDGSVFELFTANGLVATFRCYPLTPPPWYVVDPGATVVVTAHRLEP